MAAKAVSQTFYRIVLLTTCPMLLVSLFTADGTNAFGRNDMKGENATERLGPDEDKGYKKMLPAGKPGFIYMIRMVGNANGYDRAPRYVKVGLTNKPDMAPRLTSLRTANPFGLEAVATWKVTDKDPAETAAFNALKLQNRGVPFGGGTEWFRLLPLEGDNFEPFHDTVQQAIVNAGYLHPDQTAAIQRANNWGYYDP